jgi:hypothetical protein
MKERKNYVLKKRCVFNTLKQFFANTWHCLKQFFCCEYLALFKAIFCCEYFAPFKAIFLVAGFFGLKQIFDANS